MLTLRVYSFGTFFCLFFGDMENLFFWDSLGKNRRFQRLKNLLPQKLEGFADFSEISGSVNKLSMGLL